MYILYIYYIYCIVYNLYCMYTIAYKHINLAIKIPNTSAGTRSTLTEPHPLAPTEEAVGVLISFLTSIISLLLVTG